MKKLIQWLFALCILFFLESCKNDENKQKILPENLEVVPVKSLSIQEAKVWYYQDEAVNSKGARLADSNKKNPIWDDAVQTNVNGEESIVVVPLLIDKPIGYKIRDNREGKVKPENENFVSSDVKTSLIIRKFKNTIERFEMRIIADDSYYYKKGKTKLDKKDFDGYVYIFDSNDNFYSGSVYENGKPRYNLGKSSKNGRSASQILICTDWQQQVCYGETCYGWSYLRTTCEYANVDDNSSGGSITVSAIDASLGGGGNSLEAILQLPGVNDLWNRLKNVERAYFTEKYWLLPQAYMAYKQTEDMTMFLYCNNTDDGNWNAFKHTYWAATLSASLGPRTAMEITYNHEDGEPQIKKSMDIFNDNLGINIYKSVSGQVSADPTKSKEIILTAILTKINNGSARRLTPENVPFGSNITQTLIPTNSNNRCR